MRFAAMGWRMVAVITLAQRRTGDLMTECSADGCQNPAPRDCVIGRCGLHCDNQYCERHPKEETDSHEPEGTDYLGEGSDCLDDRSNDDCGAKNGRVFHGEHNTITCSGGRIILQGPSADYGDSGGYPDTGEATDDWSDVPYFD